MPELPEVETVRLGLQPVLAGERIVAARVNRKDLRFAFPERFAERLTGARVLRLDRRAKYILAPLDTAETWIIHLGMTGRFVIDDSEAAPGRFAHPASLDAKHGHVVIDLENGRRLTFHDARRFGSMDLVADADLPTYPPLALLGPEPLGPAFTAAYLLRRFAGRKPAVKVLLLDQRIVAGLGNIYVSEALHRAGIDPATSAGALKLPRLRRLVDAVRVVLEEAIEAGGSTLRDYARVGGEPGHFQHAFRVYGREGEPCLKPGCRGTIVRQVQGGRSTFSCPQCQR